MAYLQVSPKDNPRLDVSCDASRTDARIQLWRCLNIDDFSATKFYVVPWGTCCVFEVDFLSRHSITPLEQPSMSKDRLPAGWEEWGVIQESNIVVKDRNEFVKRMLTSDAFLALPKYRFESFADDVWYVSNAVGQLAPTSTYAVYKVLTFSNTAYSFKIFLDIQADKEYDASKKNENLYVSWSCLKGLEYENRDLRRSASEQLQLREDGEGWFALQDKGHPRDIPKTGGQVS